MFSPMVASVLSGSDQESKDSSASEEISSASEGSSLTGESSDGEEVFSDPDTRKRTIGVSSRRDPVELSSDSEAVASIGGLSDDEAAAESVSGSMARCAASRIFVK